MRFFTAIIIRFYAAFLVLVGIAVIIFSLNLLPTQAINDFSNYLLSSVNSRIILGLSGLLLIVISSFFAQLVLGRFQREKTIAFTTASGEVTIALTAIEDLIRRISGLMPEIKELRPDVIATKKGIVVDLRAVLKSEANIPDLTSRLQDITRSKIQEVLGLEEQIIIKIHVAKIIAGDDKDKKYSEKERPAIPFSGYGRT